MSTQHGSLAYADELDLETELFSNQLDQHTPALKLMGRSKTEIAAMDDIVEFGGTLTVSF